MKNSLNTIQKLAKHLSEYMTINGFDGQKTYTYKKRDDTIWRAVDVDMHTQKMKPGSILYVAFDSEVDLENIKPSDLLYVGSQTQDRMFRGDGLGGKNFHHKEMRLGDGENSLAKHLEKGRQVIIYTITGEKLKELSPEASIFSLVSSGRKVPHPGYSVEQLILSEGCGNWRWNSKGPDSISKVRGLTYEVVSNSI